MMKFARKALCFALSVTLLCCCAFGASAHGEKRVIRVGYPIQSGFTQKNETGQYFGYTYEYLLKLSQFTDWSYEFVEVPGDVNESLTTLLKMLQEGEIDLLGGILQNEYTEGLYDFPQLSYGIGYTQLAALEGNTAINELNFMHKVPLRVAVWTASKQRIAELQHFCEDNRITLEIIECDSVEQQYEKLCDGSADAMLNVDLSRHKNTHSIARFAGRPYYFALTKGNTALAQELDDAIRKIGETDQGFEKRLYDIYFGEETTELRLNDTERAYLETAGPITVLIAGDAAPLQYSDKGDPAGVSVRLLREMARTTGFDFTIVTAESMCALDDVEKRETVDLVVGVNQNYDLADRYDLALSLPYMRSEMTAYAPREMNLGADLSAKTLALVEGDFTELDDNVKNIRRYPTLAACLAAVNKGEADYGYGNRYAVSFELAQSVYPRLALTPMPQEHVSYCFGVTHPENTVLLGILNKAIRATSPETINQYLMEEQSRQRTLSLGTIVRANPLETVGITVAVFSGLAAVIIALNTSKNQTNRRMKVLLDTVHGGVIEAMIAPDEFSIQYINESFFALCGYTKQEFMKLHGKDWKTEFLIQEDLAVGLDEIAAAVERNESFHVEIRVRRSSGELMWLSADGGLLKREKRAILVQMICVNITPSKSYMETIIENSKMDKMTGLYDKVSVEKIIDEELKKEKKLNGVLMILDIDEFKSYNDEYGHAVGDEVITKVANELKTIARANDIIGRIGGDEFIVYIREDISEAVVCKKITDFNQTLAQVTLTKHTQRISCSAGALMLRGHDGQSYAECFDRADKALYKAKNNGKGIVSIQH